MSAIGSPSSSQSAPAAGANRAPITTLEELNALDGAEIVEGYRDGLSGDAEPGDNRSLSYWHGWRNGRADRTGVTDEAQRKLAHVAAPGGRLTI